MKVEIRNDGESNLTGTRLYLEGHQIPQLVEVSVSHRAGEPARVVAHVNAVGPLDVTLDAEVAIGFNLLPGYALISEELPNGRVRYRCEQEKEAAR